MIKFLSQFVLYDVLRKFADYYLRVFFSDQDLGHAVPIDLNL